MLQLTSRRFLRELDKAPGGNNLQYILKCPCIPFFGNQGLHNEIMLGGNGGRSGVMYEGSPYIYPSSKVAASRSNGSGIENDVEVSLADVSWGGWVLPIVLRDEVLSHELCSLLKPFHLTRNWNLLWCQRLFNISSTSHSSSPSITMGGGRACGFLPRIGSSRAADNFTTLNTGCNCLIS